MQAKTVTEFKAKHMKSFVSRAKYAIKARSVKLALSVTNDFLKYHFAQFLVVDCHGTVKYCWTIGGAYAWLPFCAKEYAQIVETRSHTTVAERRQVYA